MFTQCNRVKDFWRKIESALKIFDASINLTDEQKIFGLIGPRGNKTYVGINMIIQTAQRVIWFARKDYEDKSRETDLWDELKKRMFILFSRAHNILARQHFEEYFVRSSFVEYVGSRWKINF